MGSTDHNLTPTPDDPAVEPAAEMVEIRVKGCLDREFWADWFGGMQIEPDTEQSETVLRGAITDQAELYGLISRLRDNGLALISVSRVSDQPAPDGRE